MIRRVESALRERQTRLHLRTQWELQLVSKEKKRKRTIIYRDTFYSVSIGQRLITYVKTQNLSVTPTKATWSVMLLISSLAVRCA